MFRKSLAQRLSKLNRSSADFVETYSSIYNKRGPILLCQNFLLSLLFCLGIPQRSSQWEVAQGGGLVNQCLNRLPTHSSLMADSRHCRRRTFLTIFSAITALSFVIHSSSTFSVLSEKCTRQVNQLENELRSLLCHEKNCTVITFFRSGKYDQNKNLLNLQDFLLEIKCNKLVKKK